MSGQAWGLPRGDGSEGKQEQTRAELCPACPQTGHLVLGQLTRVPAASPLMPPLRCRADSGGFCPSVSLSVLQKHVAGDSAVSGRGGFPLPGHAGCLAVPAVSAGLGQLHAPLLLNRLLAQHFWEERLFPGTAGPRAAEPLARAPGEAPAGPWSGSRAGARSIRP